MKPTDLQQWISGRPLGEAAVRENLAIFPLLGDEAPADMPYELLGPALASGHARVLEVSESGSVPELIVRVTGPLPVLILDGEELQGAKQNRVVNTTLLLPAGKETLIPVSCTEQGRWARTSDAFAKSGNLMSPGIRGKKGRSVSASLQRHGSHASDQHEVWEEIEKLHACHESSSPTSAMADTYRQRRDDLHRLIEGLEPADGQLGLLALICGRPAGLELFGHPQALAGHFRALLESYALDALAAERADRARNAASDRNDEQAGRLRASAATFLEACAQLPAEPVPQPVGLGEELRYVSPDIVGSSLTHENRPVHAAFFRDQAGVAREPARRVRPASARARYRRDPA